MQTEPPAVGEHPASAAECGKPTTALREMSVRELIDALARVETAIRHARLPAIPAADPSSPDVGELAAEEQRIVRELRRRRLVGGR
jgi:hypothetical protein